MSRFVLPPLGVIVVSMLLFPRSGEGQGAAAPPARSSHGVRFEGTASCAATACHHGNGPRGAARSEYTTWATYDPHARAYEVLFDAKSRQMIARLRKTDSSTPDAEKHPLCLNCHVLPGARALGSMQEVSRHERFALEDGVGCESCHGPAEKWLSVHSTSVWRTMTEHEKMSLGMFPLKDPSVRAEICAGCHVGSGEREVNHDLIAAGHPRLAFEFAAYHRLWPKHWDITREAADKPHFESELWLMGQIVSARSAVNLLHHRAVTESKVWPEFAEYDCFACHHNLSDQKWRRNEERVRDRLGSPAWGTWYLALGDVVAQHPPSPELIFPTARIADLKKAMTFPGVDRVLVGKQAKGVADEWHRWIGALRQKGLTLDAPRLDQDLEILRSKHLSRYSWDEAAQLYLGLAAQSSAAQREALLRELRQALEYPRGHDSPRGFEPGRLLKAP